MITISTGSLYSYGMARTFELFKEAGFEGLEVLIDDRCDSFQCDYLRRLQRDFEMPIVSVHAPFVWRVPGWEKSPLARLHRTMELAGSVGARLVVAHLPFGVADIWTSIPWLSERPLVLVLPMWRDRAYRTFLTSGQRESEAGDTVRLAVENLPCRRVFGLKINVYQLNNLSGLSQFPSVVLDTTHLGTWGHDILEFYEVLGPRVAHIHLSNYNGREHRLPWDGILPLGKLLGRLRSDLFPGDVCLELDPSSLEANDEGKVRDNLRRSLDFCREHLGGQ